MFYLAISFYSVYGSPYLAIAIFGLVLVAMIPIFACLRWEALARMCVR
jgi:hypothetical protein